VPEDEIPESILSLAEERQIARKARNWSLADALRERISDAGYEVEDTLNGPKIKRKRAGWIS